MAVKPDVPLVIVIGLQLLLGLLGLLSSIRHADIHAYAFQEVAGNREEPGFDGNLNGLRLAKLGQKIGDLFMHLGGLGDDQLIIEIVNLAISVGIVVLP